MNSCFLIGKISSKIKFNFVIGSKSSFKKEKISIVEFEIKLLDGSLIKIIGYNEIADLCYRQLEKGDMICVYGKINTNMEIVIKEIVEI